MKKLIYVLVLLLVVAGGLVFANSKIKKEKPEKLTAKPLSAEERKAEVKKWETTPGGIQYKQWAASPEGKKVLAAAAKINIHINDSTSMEAVVTSLSLPPGSRLGLAVMASIDGVDYIVRFDPEPNQLEQLRSLKINDKIMIKSRSVSHAPKYAYPIISGDYVERDGKLLYKRIPRKDGC
jgi:hypothetical protein